MDCFAKLVGMTDLFKLLCFCDVHIELLPTRCLPNQSGWLVWFLTLASSGVGFWPKFTSQVFQTRLFPRVLNSNLKILNFQYVSVCVVIYHVSLASPRVRDIRLCAKWVIASIGPPLKSFCVLRADI